MEDISSKRGYKDIGDAVGMPDAKDKENLRRIILNYEKANPGVIQFHRDAAKEHMGTQLAGKNDFAEMSKLTGDKNSGRRYMMELPPELHTKLEMYIPTLFRSKRHFNWFCKNFRELVIPEKI